jgi:hypothetical protein
MTTCFKDRAPIHRGGAHRAVHCPELPREGATVGADHVASRLTGSPRGCGFLCMGTG